MDLHIHTCLSPCGDSRSVPTSIVNSALQKKIDALAICDHNASENVKPVRQAAEGSGLVVFGGMEITTRSEIHVLGLFDDNGDLSRMQDLIYENLPGENDKDVFGPQYIVDCEDYVLGYNEHLLIGAVELDIEEIIQAIHDCGGAAIASHIDKEAFSILSQFGMIPEGLELDAVEFSRNYTNSPYDLSNIGYPVVTFSDAHHPDQIGEVTTEFWLDRPSIAEIKKAFTGDYGGHFASCT